MPKAPNYTPEQTADMVERYTAVREEAIEVRNAVVAEIAAELGKSVRSVRSKLSREEVYVAAKAVSKVTGAAPAKKETLAADLVRVTGLALVSAEKLNKTDLVALIKFAEAATATEVEED